MSEHIQIEQLFFKPFITHDRIVSRIKEIAGDIQFSNDSHFLVVGEGANVFFYELIQHFNKPELVWNTVQVKSYEGLLSKGVPQLIGDLKPCQHKDVIIVEDVIDTGKTINFLKNQLEKLGVKSITIVTLLFKPQSIQYDFDIQHIGFEIGNEFVLGYGLDYNGYGRALTDLYQLKE